MKIKFLFFIAILGVVNSYAQVGIGTNNPNSTLTNNGSMGYIPIDLGNFTANGSMGAATATVDVKAVFNIPQTTPNISLTIPNPTATTETKVFYVTNTSTTVGITVGGVVILPKQTQQFVWNTTNAAWGVASGNLNNFASTQWSKTIATTAVNNGTFLNLFTLLNNVTDKIASGTTSYDEYNIVANGIIIPWTGKRLSHNIRVNFNFVTGGTQTLRLELRRISDNSVIGPPVKATRNVDFGGDGGIFKSYTASITDPFVTGGFYIALANNSGTNISITGGLDIYIETFYQY